MGFSQVKIVNHIIKYQANTLWIIKKEKQSCSQLSAYKLCTVLKKFIKKLAHFCCVFFFFFNI